MQDDKERMVIGSRKVIKVTMFVTTVCMISLGAVAEPMIYTLIGTKWHEAATYLPLICISMSLYPLHAINLNILQVLGRSDIFFIFRGIEENSRINSDSHRYILWYILYVIDFYFYWYYKFIF